MYCFNCGKKIEKNWKYCMECGVSLRRDELEIPEKIINISKDAFQEVKDLKNLEIGVNLKEKYPYVPTFDTISTDFVVVFVKKSRLNGSNIEVGMALGRGELDGWKSTMAFVEKNLYNNIYICPKSLIKEGEDVKREAIFKTPEYLRDIQDFITVKHGIYFIRNNELYLLHDLGLFVNEHNILTVIKPSLPECFALHRQLNEGTENEIVIDCFTGYNVEYVHNEFYNRLIGRSISINSIQEKVKIEKQYEES